MFPPTDSAKSADDVFPTTDNVKDINPPRSLHFDYVAAEVAKGIATVSLETEFPVIFGVLTTDTIEQAIERAGTKVGNKGCDAVLTAIEMVNLLRQI